MKFTFHTDPGHGWLAVPRAELNRVGVEAEITPYSYQSTDGSVVYLEEDCDAPTFIEAFKRLGGTVELGESYSEHTFIRTLPHYSKE